MASYNSNQLEGVGAPIEALTSGSTYTFALTSSVSSSTYFTLESARNSIGTYDSSSSTTAAGTIENLTNVTGLVSSSYIFSVIVNPGGGSLNFTPSTSVAASGSFLRGTGGISLNIVSPIIPTTTTTTTISSPVDLGTQVAFTQGTLFDAYSSRSGVTTTDAFNTNNGCWQLYYAHQNITIQSGSNTIGLNPNTNGSNSWTWYYSISNSSNTIGNWGSVNTLAALKSFSYTAGTLAYSNVSSNINIPAGRYFLISNSGGPFYRTVKTMASNRTAMVSGLPYFTVINQVALGNWPSGGTTAIPTQFNGAGTGYTFYSGSSHVHSVTFA